MKIAGLVVALVLLIAVEICMPILGILIVNGFFGTVIPITFKTWLGGFLLLCLAYINSPRTLSKRSNLYAQIL